MKIIKRFFYIIFGILLVGTISLTGIMLYAEYSGRRFHPGSLEEITGNKEEDSRLAYDSEGNIIELPGNSQPSSPEAEAVPSSGMDTSVLPETSVADTMGTDVSNVGKTAVPLSDPGESPNSESSGTEPAEAPAEAPAAQPASDPDTEQLYIMDLGTGLFHIADCSDVAGSRETARGHRPQE